MRDEVFTATPHTAFPAKAGIHQDAPVPVGAWVPAFAGKAVWGVAVKTSSRIRGPVCLALGEAAGAEHALFADVAKRHRAQIQVDLIAQFLPEIMGQTSAAIAAAADRFAGGTSHRVERLVDRDDNVGNPDLVAVMPQAIAAAGPAHAADQATAPQLGKELLEIGERDLLPFGDLGERDRVAAAVPGEVDHRHHRIAAPGADLHGCALARCLTGSAVAAAPSSVGEVSRARSSSPMRARSVDTSSSNPFSARAIGSGISTL